MTAYECQHQSIPGLTLYLQQFLEFTYYLSSKINVSVVCVISSTSPKSFDFRYYL